MKDFYSRVMLHHGNCVDSMRTMPDNSVDSIVTDPPYELGFMGKSWDASGIAYSVEMWQEALRVLKPGGHLLAFSGSRTYHRMTCAIEDAGFEVRDQIMWVYSTGFPKSFNMDRERGKSTCDCSTGTLPYAHEKTEQNTECSVRPVPNAYVPAPLDTGEGGREILQSGVPEQSTPFTEREQFPQSEIWGRQSSVEGRRDDISEKRELQEHSLSSCASEPNAHGSKGRVYNGASSDYGAMVRTPVDPDGSSSSREPRSFGQSTGEPGIMAEQQQPQTLGAWPVCSRCGKPVVPRGLGTALKPAHEPICVARKPLGKGNTVAANVLAHGTGALNIDECRVGTENTQRTNGKTDIRADGGMNSEQGGSESGRWPANLIHDGSDEVTALFPHVKSGGDGKGQSEKAEGANCYGVYNNRLGGNRGPDTGSAARFFYCAKTSKKDRNEGLEGFEKKTNGVGALRDGGRQSEGRENTHPTVKPTDLMRYLCRMVTPPNGVILDPFLGSGSTGKAAVIEGFRFIGCELSAEYIAIASRRIFEAGKD